MVDLLEEDKEEFLLDLVEIHNIEETDFPHVDLAREGRPIDWAHVEDLKNSDPLKWPPVLVTRTTIGYVLLDGYHRREAIKKRKGTAIRATCKTFKDKRDAINAVFEPNVIHGLKASSQTKSDYAYFLWVSYTGITHKEIGLRANLSRSGVSHAIARKTPKPAETGEPETKPETKPAEGGAPEGEAPKGKEAGAITEAAREEKGIAPVIRPGTQPDEEVRRKAIERSAGTLRDKALELRHYLQDVQADTLRAAGITTTLEAVRAVLAEATTIVDDVLQRSRPPDKSET